MRNSTKKENRPPCPAPMARQRFRKIPPGIYENAETGKVIIIIDDSEYYFGHIRIRQGKYKYASWRQGKKIREKYLGTVKSN
ncbi:MAG: hypothetical protein FP827_05235 [Candidatus Omnitrophica bacterium]|nr:hypothetical protein [Candidatus Omnitrophota bacterium]